MLLTLIACTGSPPETPGVVLGPLDPTTAEDLIASVDPVTDPDGDEVTLVYRWFRDAVEVEGQDSDTLPSSETAKGDLDESELPALIVYQDGDFKGSEKRVGREAGETLTVRAVEEVLMRMGVRLTSASAMQEADVAALQKLKELGVSSAGAYGRVGLSGGGRQDVDDDDEDDEDEEDY